MADTVTITATEFADLTHKANKWDALDTKIGAIYGGDQDTEEGEADLGDIGEAAASAFGYL
jgi:hypothetical protein